LTKTIAKILLAVLFCLISYSEILAQSTELQSSDTVQTKQNEFIMKKSPWGAVLRSAIIPGFGQFYNESYWKIPLFWGILGYLGYNWIDQNNLYRTYRDLYNQSFNETTKIGNTIYQNQRDRYRDQRDIIAIYIGLTYFLNLVDAYVDAHLFDFDVSDSINGKQLNISLRVNF